MKPRFTEPRGHLIPEASSLWFRCLAMAMATLMFPLSLAAQTEEMKVSDEVETLQQQLESASFEDRDDAEQEMIKLGSAALDYIADPADEFTEDFNVRLKRIRKKLEQLAIEEAVSPSKISLAGEVSLKTAFAEIKKQTGNVIALAEGYDPALLEKKIQLDLEDATFWKAFAEIRNRGGLNSSVYGGAAGQTTVTPSPPADPATIDKAVALAIPQDESGIFRIRVAAVSSARNLQNPKLDYTRVDLEIQWEPRLNPISIEMPLSKVKVLDANGDELKVSNPRQVLSGTVQEGINQIELSLSLENVDRKIDSISSVAGRLECVLPGRREKFRFAKVAGIEGQPEIGKAGIKVRYLGWEENEDLFGVNLRISMDDAAGEFESHLSWLYDNPLYLIDDTGKKESSIGHQGGDLNEDGVEIQYFFVEPPAEFGLLYESPGAIVSLPADFTLKDIPLP